MNYGDTLTVTITANANYAIDSVFVDDVYVGAVGSYAFETITANHTLSATFRFVDTTKPHVQNDNCNGSESRFS
jgi:hypothetical protein